MQKVLPYYPNQWRRLAGDLVPKEDRGFNWFLCSKRYYDSRSGRYVAEVTPGTKFYNPESGHTLAVPIGQNVVVLIDQPTDEAWDVVKRYGYQGVATMTESSIDDRICADASFYFLDGILETSTKESTCSIVIYAKRNYRAIRGVLPDFPTPAEIDDAIARYSCRVVCKVLYQDVIRYLAETSK